MFLAWLSSVGLLVCILATLSSIHTKVSACCACVRVARFKAGERCVAARVVRYRAAFVSWRIDTVAPWERVIPASRQSRPNDCGSLLTPLFYYYYYSSSSSSSIIIYYHDNNNNNNSIIIFIYF